MHVWLPCPCLGHCLRLCLCLIDETVIGQDLMFQMNDAEISIALSILCDFTANPCEH